LSSYEKRRTLEWNLPESNRVVISVTLVKVEDEPKSTGMKLSKSALTPIISPDPTFL
jgi:hypothetical protein